MKVIIIGSGIGGLATACLLGKQGHEVTVFEKNAQLGGRAGSFTAQGFRFDTGPSWYLMPEVFERFFSEMGENIHDHLDLIRLSPSFQASFAGGENITITKQLTHNKEAFEQLEPGAGKQLAAYLQKAASIYDVALDRLLYRNYHSTTSLFSPGLLTQARRLKLFDSLQADTRRYVKDERLQQLLQFCSIFLGTDPAKAPAFYGLLNHALYTQGVYYPRGGMYRLIEALERVGSRFGVTYRLRSPVERIMVQAGLARGVMVGGLFYDADAVMSDAGVQYTETSLLDPAQRDYSARYWHGRTLAPSALLMYLGTKVKYDGLKHHNLLIAKNWHKNFDQIFDKPSWPEQPSLYVCAPSRTDPTVAPEGHENLFVLVPLAAGLDYTSSELNTYAAGIIKILEKDLKLPDLPKHLIYQKLFCVKDFESQFNSPHGTGLGLAHTLKQSALWRPDNRSRKVKGLYYVGADVHPGIGLPTCLISAQLVAEYFKRAP